MRITLDGRFRGPLTSANGGYACGRLASLVHAPEVEVTLRLPPPLERSLEVRRDGGRVSLLDGDDLVADARPSSVELATPEPVSFDVAHEAERGHVRVGSTVFRECFVCGIRDASDGLAIYAGPVPGREPVHAATWVVREVAPAIVWAAIDCPGAYAVGAAGRGEIVLGRMTGRIDRLPALGERCVVAAWPLGEDGRKLYAGTALYGEDGETLAVARQVWIEPKS
jgi:hypothetical protein